MFDSLPVVPASDALQQSLGFERALAAVGSQCQRLDDGTLLLQRRWGPVRAHMLARVTVTPERLAQLRRAGVRGPVILSPETPVDTRTLPALPLVSPNTLAALDLTPDLEALRAGLHQKWRNRLKHAEKQGLRVTRQNLPDQPDHWLLVADLAQQAARRYRGWPPALTCAYGRENPGDAKLFTAYIGRAPVAGVVILRHGACATYHIGHTRPSGRMTSAHCLLLWQAICWLKRKGVAHFELGLIDTEDGAGLARFKLGTGATVRALGGTWLWWPPLTRLARPLARLDRTLMQTR
ncbi:MAG: GNAT family N-acetyltransferase [Pseudomonadota bacterium]